MDQQTIYEMNHLMDYIVIYDEVVLYFVDIQFQVNVFLLVMILIELLDY